MADPDFSRSVDVDAVARALATKAFPEAVCRERVAKYVRGEWARDEIEAIQKAFVATHDGETAYKPALIAQLSCMHDGAFSSEKVWRLFRCLAETGSYYGVRLLDVTVSPIANLSQQLSRVAGDPDATLRDLVSWVELGDEAALARITPVVVKAGVLACSDIGKTDATGARLLDVLALRCTGLDAKLDALLAHAEGMIVEGNLLAPLATWLERHAGPRRGPAVKVHATNDHDRAHVRAVFVAFWRLARDHRALFDARGARLFAKFSWKTDEMLRKLAVIDDEATVKKTWRIFRAGPVVWSTSGNVAQLARMTTTVYPTEAKATAEYNKKLAAKKRSK